MIEASRWTTGLAALALVGGLAATIALPRTPSPSPSPSPSSDSR